MVSKRVSTSTGMHLPSSRRVVCVRVRLLPRRVDKVGKVFGC